MKTETFVELKVSTWHPCGGIWGEWNAINMSEVAQIYPDKNWCRLEFKNGRTLLITDSYENTVKRISEA